MKAIDWNPWSKNPLDYIGEKGLVDRDGKPVTISQQMRGGFIVTVGSSTYKTGDNVETCAFLNKHDVVS